MLKIKKPTYANIYDDPTSLRRHVENLFQDSDLLDSERTGVLCLIISGFEVGAKLEDNPHDDVMRFREWVYNQYRELSSKIED